MSAVAHFRSCRQTPRAGCWRNHWRAKSCAAALLLTAGLGGVAWPSIAAEASATAASRVAAMVDRANFTGEILVADRTSVLVSSASGGMTTGMRWNWASVSKQVAAALTMRQVQAGKLHLDDPVLRHLPAAAAHTGVTVRHLLMHTSGLPNPEVADLPADPLPTCLGSARHPPGERFEYRNCDTLVLAALLTRVSGLPYAQLLHRELSAAMGSHGVVLATTPANVAAYGASAALAGTALDLLAFDRALLAEQWLSAEHTRTMWTGEPRLGYVALGAWAYEARIPGCAAPVALVERRGAIPGVQARNLIAPALGRVVIAFTPSESFEFGEVWQGRGFTHDLLAATLCS